MQTRLSAAALQTPDGREADGILRTCVHCGFCAASCPTYRLLGDELDGPRGRIYLIKEMLESRQASRVTQLHLDRCLTCRACETACPSGVRYGRLLDIGRRQVEQIVPRTIRERLLRRALLATFPHRTRVAALLALARMMRPLMPPRLRRRIPAPPPHPRAGAWPVPRHARRMLVLTGCVQPAAAPGINAAAARVLDRLGISLIRVDDACCGALAYHLAREGHARAQMRRNIDAWWPEIEQGAEAIIVTASGCGAMIQDYGALLGDDPAYARKAVRTSELLRDISQVVAQELTAREADPKKTPEPGPDRAHHRRVAFHAPCTLQHALGIRGLIEPILARAGYFLTAVADGQLCCGSAGSYSLLQPQISRQLRANKLAALEAGGPEVIVSANIGCLLHLAGGTDRPVRHWIELLAEAIGEC
jgi:glycolate dehydrogenase iron-sulfur subunit